MSLAAGFFEHPDQGSARLEGWKGRRSLPRCRHLERDIETDDCLLDPRLIAPSFSPCPVPALASPPGALHRLRGTRTRGEAGAALGGLPTASQTLSGRKRREAVSVQVLGWTGLIARGDGVSSR